MSDKKGVVLERLRELIDSSGKTRDEIAKAIECDTSTITKHYNGNRQVAPEFIIKYAQFFGVSSDYLLGLSNAESTDKDIQFISKYTGLSDEAIEALNRFYKCAVSDYDEFDETDSILLTAIDTLNRLVENNTIHFLSAYINEYYTCTKQIKEHSKLEYEKLKNNTKPTAQEVLHQQETENKRDLAMFRAQELINRFIKRLCKDDLNEIEEYNEKYYSLKYQQLQDLVKEIDV